MISTPFLNQLAIYVAPPSLAQTFMAVLSAAIFSALLWLDRVLYYFVLNWDQVLFALGLSPIMSGAYIWIQAEREWSNAGDYLWWEILVFWLIMLPSELKAWVEITIRWWKVVFWLIKVLYLVAIRRTVLGWLLELMLAWVYRGTTAPPPVQRAEVTIDGTIPMAQLAHGRGIVYAQAANLPHASVVAGGLTPARLRRHSRWVGMLQEYLGGRPGVVGELVRGRWIPDLTSTGRPLTVNSVLALLDGEAKLLGGGVLPTDDLMRHEPFLVVELLGKGRQVIVPNLMGRLCRNTFGRERDSSLLAQLRSRAVEWCADAKVAASVVPLIVPGHVALAMVETAPERLAREQLEEDGFTPFGDR